VKQILNPTDENTLNLLSDYTMTNGRNYDVLIKIENDTITAKTLEQLIVDPEIRISAQICYNAMSFPWLDHTNLRETFFNGWVAPSFYDRFQKEKDKIIVERLEQHTIPFNDYVKIAENKIEKNIKSILDSSKQIVMCYSAGIDSILLLSYLIKYDRVKDTHLVHTGNNLTKKPFTNFSLENKLGLKIDTFFITQDAITKYVNQSNPFMLKECVNYCVQDYFKNQRNYMKV